MKQFKIFFIANLLPLLLLLSGCGQESDYHGFDLISNINDAKISVSGENQLRPLKLKPLSIKFDDEGQTPKGVKEEALLPVIAKLKDKEMAILQFPLNFEQGRGPDRVEKEGEEKKFAEDIKKLITGKVRPFDPKSWFNYSGAWKKEAGRYTLTTTSSGKEGVLLNDKHPFRDGVVNFSVTFDEGGPVANRYAGIIFRAKDDKNYNVLELFPDGRLLVCRVREGGKNCYGGGKRLSPGEKFDLALIFIEEDLWLFYEGKWHPPFRLPYISKDEGFVGLLGNANGSRISFENLLFNPLEARKIKPKSPKKKEILGIYVKKKDGEIMAFLPEGRNYLALSNLTSNRAVSRTILSNEEITELNASYWVFFGDRLYIVSKEGSCRTFSFSSAIEEAGIIRRGGKGAKEVAVRSGREEAGPIKPADLVRSVSERVMFNNLLKNRTPTDGSSGAVVPIVRVKVDRDTRDCILAVPDTRVMFKTYVPGNALLHFGVGMPQEAALKSDGMLFQVLAGPVGEEPKEIMAHILSAKGRDRPRWADFDIDLNDLGGGEVEFTLKTSGGPKSKSGPSDNLFDFGLWSRPVITQKRKKREPNVILVSLDNLRADHLTSYGYRRNTSPNLDLFARGGALFKNVYSQAPWTLPSHIAIFTSQYPSVFSREFNVGSAVAGKASMPESALTLQDILARRGYLTAGFSGGGYMSASYGFSQGFTAYKEEYDLMVAYKKVEDWLDRHKDDKFYLMFHTYGYSWLKGEQYKIYDDESTSDIVNKYDSRTRFDDNFMGLLVKKLNDLGLLKNTLFVITSDHGEEMSDHGRMGHGFTLYDEMTKIPLMIRFPKRIKKNVVVESTVRSIDIVPTILDYLYVKIPDTLEGTSLRGYIEGSETRELPAFSEGVNDWDEYGIADKKSIVIKNRKLILSDPGSKGVFESAELYDLGKDPGERKNLSVKDKKIVDEFRSQVERINRSNSIKYKGLKDRKKPKLTKETLERLKSLGYIQ